MLRTLAIAALALAFALALPAAAQVYKWVDKDGKIHYSDKPPRDPKAKGVKDLHIESKPTDPAAVERELAELTERGKSVDDSLRVQEQVKTQTAAQKAAAEQMCDQAMARLAALEQVQRMAKVDKDGNRTYASDGETNTEREKARKQVDELCK
jgi:hypothetical protein